MNIQDMMQKAQKMQSRMQEMQIKLGQIEVLGTSGGGLVTLTATCKGEVKKINIDPSLLKPEEKEVLEDLVVAAYNDAKSRADGKLAEETQRMMSDLGLPANMQLPF